MKKNSIICFGIAVFATCLLAKAFVDYDHSVNFAKYHTYSWVSVQVQDPLWKDRVANAIDQELSAKGWRKVETGGDAAIVAVGATHTERTIETWYDGGFGGGWRHRGWWGGPAIVTTTVERTPVGTLHIDIFDSQSKKVVWHGNSSDTLAGDPAKNEKKLKKAVADLFKKFPPEERGAESSN